MSLTEKDLQNIKDLIEFSAEQSEQRMEEMVDRKLIKVIEKIDREVSDIAEMNRNFIAKLDNHENRIGKLEFNTGLASE